MRRFHIRKLLFWGLLCLGFCFGLWAPAALAQLNLLPTPSASSLPEVQLLTQKATESTQDVAELRSLFYREPWSFGPETFTQVWQDMQTLPDRLNHFFQSLTDRGWQQHDWLWLGLGLLTLLVAGLFIWLDRRFQHLPDRLLPALPEHTPFWLQRLSKSVLVVLGRLVLLFCLLFAVYVLWGAFASEQRYFPLVVDLLWLYLIYRAVQTTLYELLIQEKEQLFRGVSAEIAARLYRRLSGFTLFSALFWMGIFIFRDTGYRHDHSFVEFLYFVYSGILLIFVSYLISRKADVFGLFPEIDEPVYKRFVSLFQRFYLYVSSFTLLLGLFWIAGYRSLAGILFMRSWALVGLILGVRLLHRLVHHLLQNYLNPDPIPHDSRLIRSIMRALMLLEVLLLIHGSLSLLGIRQALLGLFNRPIATIGTHSVISPLSFVNGLLTLLIFWMVTQILDAFLQERIFPTRFDAGIHQMISMSVFYTVMALGVLMTLNIIGIDLSVFTIFAGALAFGIGFGLQGIAKNFASGLVLIFTGLVKKGDYITVSGQSGYIQDVSWKKVLLRTPDHVDLIIPTVDLVESTITNWTYSNKEVRMHLPVGVSYEADMNQVKTALLEAAAEHPEVLKHPAPDVWMVEFGDSSVNFELLIWIDCTHITRERLRGELNFMIWNALKRHEIEIPFPQRDLHLRSGFELLQTPPTPPSSNGPQNETAPDEGSGHKNL